MRATSAREGGSRELWAVGLAAALIAGVVLRLIWPNDIEFKSDERWMFARALNVGVTEPWPWLGMPSSATVANPGLNVWFFAALRRLSQAADPPELARAVQVLNICAIAILVFFALRIVGEKEREPWLWAGAWLRKSNSYPLSAQDMAALRAANLHDRAPDRLVAARPPRGRIRMGPRGCNPRSNRDRGILLRCGLRPLDGDLSTAGRAMESVVRRLCARRAPDAPLARLPAPRILAAPRVSGPLFASVRIQFLDTMGHRALRSGAELLAG